MADAPATKGHRYKGKGKGRRPFRHSNQERPDSPETWRSTTVAPTSVSKSPKVKQPLANTTSPPSEVETQTRIVNANLSLPWTQGRLKPESQDLIDALVRANPNVSCTAWVPMVDLNKDQGLPSHGSVLGGNKCWIKRSEALPVCIACKSPLNFVCQIDRASLLQPLQGSGIVQVFACPQCVRDPTVKPRAACWATVIEGSKNMECREVPAPSMASKRVVKWLPRKDFVHPIEAEELLNRSLSVEEWRALGEAQLRGDKIGGYAAWLSCPATERNRLKCKMCDKQQRLLLSLDCMDHVAFEWGNDGSLLVFDCLAHPDQVSALVVST
jgi:hypothetical protein